MSSYSSLTLIASGCALLIYGMFQKHMLPDGISKWVARIYYYPTLPFFALNNEIRRPAFKEPIDEGVWFGGMPITWMGHLSKMQELGIKAVVNLCDEASGPTKEYAKLNIEQLRLPTIDHTEPTLEDMKKAVAFIEQKRNSRCGVYVHCRGGHGRSAAIVMAWLIWKHQMSPEQAQAYINAKRQVRKKLYEQLNIGALYAELRKAKQLKNHQ